jgi:hypothetical protein
MKYTTTLLALAAFLATALPATAQMHAPIPMTKAQFENAAIGASVQIAVRVTSAKRTTVEGELLQALSETQYATTGTTVQLYVPADTPVVMGSAADIKPGAVLYLFAVVTGRDRADVKKAVVSTQYVTVK